jgi:hypothetical protein
MTTPPPSEPLLPLGWVLPSDLDDLQPLLNRLIYQYGQDRVREAVEALLQRWTTEDNHAPVPD